MKYALVDNGIVLNVAAWDGVTPWNSVVPTVQLLPGESCGPGWTYDPARTPRFEAPDDDL